MSPEESARAAAATVMNDLSDRRDVLDGLGGGACTEIEAEIAAAIAAAIRAAVAEERERCAEVALAESRRDDLEGGETWIAINIAKSIREEPRP